MAKDEINYAALRAHVMKLAVERAEIALEIYTLEHLKYDDPGYGYARDSAQRSIRAKASQSITVTERGIRIAVESVGARFIELGNAPGGVAGVRIRARKKPALVVPLAGGGVALVSSVSSYGPTNRLRNAVMAAFGFRV